MFALKAVSDGGLDLWFQKMVHIGPMTTANPGERAEFVTREDAQRCPAMFHMLSTFEIVDVGQ